jgi:hypothetical protein
LASRLRVEILLPLRYNDGQLIEPSKFLKTEQALVQQFGGCTALTPTSGVWLNPKDSQLYQDINSGFYVDCPNKQETFKFLRKFKKVLKKDFDQKVIYIAYYKVNVL